ncbi:MAG: hypothetical protein IJL08_02905 [Oscillospiraceae bacterium]|nr:hypothetical protein [Oscillospiraceae bacterium]
MKKLTAGALWLAILLSLSAVTACADIIDPEPAVADSPQITAAIVATVVIAAAVIAWMIIRSRRSK